MAEKTNANIGFEKQLWDAACVLWGHIPAAEYRKVIIGLIFLRYISAAFDKRNQELVDEGDGFEDDRDGFYRLPTSFDIRDYDIMEDFVETLSGAAHDRLDSAILGRGAFRRFKDTVYDLGIDQQWYDFQAAAYKRKAARWCEENGIEYEE